MSHNWNVIKEMVSMEKILYKMYIVIQKKQHVWRCLETFY